MATEVAGMSEHTAVTPPDHCMICAEDLWKTYDMGSEQQVHALRGINVRINRNEYVAIMGPSGSGKSTLMNLIGCLDTPSAGRYWLNQQLVSDLDDDELARIRNKEIGFVFQTFNLLPRATALHNVELPLIYAGIPAEERVDRARGALRAVDLESRMMHKPNELPADNASASRLHAPSSTILPSSWPTSRPATWTHRPVTKSWPCSTACTARATPSCWSPTSTTLPPTPIASSISKTA